MMSSFHKPKSYSEQESSCRFFSYQGAGNTSPKFNAASGAQAGSQSVNTAIDFGVLEVVARNIEATFSAATINASLTNTGDNFISGAGGNVYSMSGLCVDPGGCGANGLFASGEASVNFVGTRGKVSMVSVAYPPLRLKMQCRAAIL